MAMNVYQVNNKIKRYLWAPLELQGIEYSEEEKFRVAAKLLKEVSQPHVRSPQALLVWLAKKEKAVIVEANQNKQKKKAKTKTNMFGEEVLETNNIFLKLGGEYETEPTASGERRSSRAQ